MRDVSVEWLGLCDYEKALELQDSAAKRVEDSGQALILACEHPTVITLGKRGQPVSDILASMDILRERQIKIIGTDRGGQATLHNPGQLVIYPIIPLRLWGLGVRHYVEVLERTTALFLAEYGMDITRGYEPGLFVNGQKLAAFGIRVERGVSRHGVAINVNNELDVFSLIKQCGQIVRPTNLNKEMATFGASRESWDFKDEAQKWTQIFLSELPSFI